MPELTPVSWRNLVLRLRLFGFSGPFKNGKHPYMIKKALVLTIASPFRKEIGTDLLMRILKQAGIDYNAWLNTQ